MPGSARASELGDVAQPPHRRLTREKTPNRLREARQRVSLEKVGVETRLRAFLIRSHPRREGDEASAVEASGPRLPAKVEPASTGHLDVGDHDGRVVALNQLPGPVSISRFDDGIAFKLKLRPEHGSDIRVVIGNEHRRFRAGPTLNPMPSVACDTFVPPGTPALIVCCE